LRKTPGDYSRFVDLSVDFASLKSQVYPGSPLPLRSTFTTIADTGFQSNIWTFEEHTGTHVDAPAHTVVNGDSIEATPLSRYIGKGIVLDFSRYPSRAEIGERDISKRLGDIGLGADAQLNSVLLFYTGYTSKFGTPKWLDNPVLGRDACEFIAGLGVKAVGIDAATPDRDPYPAHKLLLPKGIPIFENLANLDRLLRKEFVFVGAPIPLVGGTGSPVRALALLH
jgi:arylformamidase